VEQKTGVEMRSVLTVPLIVNHKVIGVLQATDTEPNRFDPKDQRLLESMATPSAIAIDNARLYQQTQQDAITRAALLDEVNHRVKNNLTAILGILYAEQRHAQDHPERPYEQMLDDLINRVQGLTTVHAMLSDSEWSPLLLSDLVERVIQALVKAMPPSGVLRRR
jgi:K+-sensing histidine kinase KdpD